MPAFKTSFSGLLESRTALFYLFLVLYALLSLYMFGLYLVSSNFGDSVWKTPLKDIVDGTGRSPYVYRMLVPWLTWLIVNITPDYLQHNVNQAILMESYEQPLRSIIAGRLDLQEVFRKPEMFYMRGVVGIINYLFLCGYMAALYMIGRAVAPQSWATALVMPLAGILMVMGVSDRPLFIYDLPTLFFSAACYYCLAKERWRWFFLWFTLGCFNKETMFFVMVFYVLWFGWRLPRLHFIFYGSLQLCIFLLVRAAIIGMFIHNPGPVLERHIAEQIISLLDPNMYSYKTPAALFVIALLLTWRWEMKPLFARYVLWLLPLMYVAHLRYGVPGEYRVFFDLFPLLTLLVTDTLVECSGLAKAKIFNRSGMDHVAIG